MRRAVADAALRGDADLVHVEWTPLVANVPEAARVPLVVSAHNVETEIWERYRAQETSPLRRAYVSLQARKVRRMERLAFARADAVLAVSERDAERIRPLARPGAVTVVRNGVDVDGFAPDPRTPVDPEAVVFVGALDWRPNQDGLGWLVDEVWPRVRAARPSATLHVVGRAPPAAFAARLEAAGARVHASVPDVRPHVRSAAVSVVPLRIGGGSRLKIAEALALGRPVVSTPVGAEGLDVGDGVVLAEGAEAFAAGILAALADPPAAAARAARGRACVLERHAWDRIAPLQGRAWEQALRRRGGAA
jgi:glycosyltransferase involved in cell wall biosynthesis